MEICKNCGRRLKGAKSKERGYGPVCYSKIYGTETKGNNYSSLDSSYSIFENYEVPGQIEISDYLKELEENIEND